MLARQFLGGPYLENWMSPMKFFFKKIQNPKVWNKMQSFILKKTIPLGADLKLARQFLGGPYLGNWMYPNEIFIKKFKPQRWEWNPIMYLEKPFRWGVASSFPSLNFGGP